MIYSNEWLHEQIAEEKRLKYLYFWGHRPRGDGRANASCLSQWFNAGFTHEGIHYPTAEHWMMAGKAKLFGDEDVLAKIQQTDNPAVAKKLGREVKGFDVAVWEQEMVGIVTEGSYLKFSQNPKLKEWLLTTGNKILVEASPFDNVWGIGLRAEEAEQVGPEGWRGHNWLGWCLMEARDRIRQE